MKYPTRPRRGAGRSRAFILRSDPGLLGQKGDGFTEVRADCPGSGRAILRPPLGRFANLNLLLERKS